MKITKDNIVFVQYNGHNRPHQVCFSPRDGSISPHMIYKFFQEEYEIRCRYATYGMPSLSKRANLRKRMKVWFKPEYRPYDSEYSDRLLTNAEINGYGYEIITEPLFINEIIDAINY
ncbi:MAG: hypothetical protein KGZ71_09965 [Desulfobulbaceae bacterium]|nr:hypothetical protein [Candidatus Kapabacteria bacterium]MBS4000793.1 hypothetical protein [Desulfobulbaceae bacterium]